MVPALAIAAQAIAGVCLAVYAVGYAFLLTRAALDARRAQRRAHHRTWGARELAASESQPVVTVIVPAHDEADAIIPALRSLLRQQWHHLEVIVVPNGCTDATMAQLADAYDLRATGELLDRPRGARGRIIGTWRSAVDPRLRVLETTGGGKADAANCALERATGELTLLVDADSILAPLAIARAALPFIERGESVVAVSATIRVLNGARQRPDGSIESTMPASRLARLQMIEYARAFQIGRAGWSSIGALPVVSGAFGMFRTSVLRAVGGLDVDTVGEDLELIMRLHAQVRRAGRRGDVVFLPEPLCWTEVPEDIDILRAQRVRWHRGLVETARRHRRMLLNDRHGAVGLVSFPFLGIFELLAPLVELLGIAALAVAASAGLVAWTLVLTLGLFSVCFGMALSMSAVMLEQIWERGFVSTPRDVLLLLRTALVEQLGHRQRTAVWRLRGLIGGLRGGRATWGEMRHRGAREIAAR